MAIYQSETLDADCAAAFRSVRFANWIFMVLVLLSLLAVLATVVLVRFVGVLEPPAKTAAPAASPAGAPATAPETAPASAPAKAPGSSAVRDAATAGSTRSKTWDCVLGVAMAIARAAAPLACLLIVIAFFLASNLAMVAQKGGSGAFVSGFFWSLVLLVLLAPWQLLFPGLLPGVTPEISDLGHGPDTTLPRLTAAILFYMRYLGLPVVALLAWILVAVKFARGYRKVAAATSVPPSSPERPSSGQ
ncbi:MAG: hypothetical protein ACE15C_02925 [Phycisphaerae bacterium]